MSFTCPRCGMTSYNVNDEKHGYCGACHDWTGGDRPVIQVIMNAHFREAFEEWLSKHGFVLVRLPDEEQDPNDLQVYVPMMADPRAERT